MNKADREHLRKNFIRLGDAIAPRVLGVVDLLYFMTTFSMNLRNEILDSNDPEREKAFSLLDFIPTRGRTAFEDLYTAVLEYQLFDAADILKPGKAPHGLQHIQSTFRTDGYESPDEHLPHSWPSDDTFNAFKHLRKVEERHTKMRARFNKTATPRGQEDTYLMSAKLRGRVLVINNEEFTTLDKRDGTLQDLTAIDTLFRELGFEVQVERNKTKEDMWKLLEEESKKESHSQANCFVLFLMTHGHNNVVYGTDGRLDNNKKPVNYIVIQDIVDLFCGMKHLEGKLKLFFIQACQGGTKNGESAGSADNSGASSSGGDGVDTDNSDAGSLGGVWVDTGYVPMIFYGADFHLAISTLPGHLTWRNTAKGTCFVQAVVYVIAKFAYALDLSCLMQMVNCLVGRADTEKQQSQAILAMCKSFYFFPGLSRGN